MDDCTEMEPCCKMIFIDTIEQINKYWLISRFMMLSLFCSQLYFFLDNKNFEWGIYDKICSILFNLINIKIPVIRIHTLDDEDEIVFDMVGDPWYYTCRQGLSIRNFKEGTSPCRWKLYDFLSEDHQYFYDEDKFITKYKKLSMPQPEIYISYNYDYYLFHCSIKDCHSIQLQIDGKYTICERCLNNLRFENQPIVWFK